MQYRINARPTFSFVELELDAGEKIVADSGVMAWMGPEISLETSTRGGMLKGLSRKFLTGESFFQNTYQAASQRGRIAFAPGACGDIVAMPLDGELVLEKGAYLASQPGVECNAKWDGFKGLFSEGFFVLRVAGKGMLFFASYGEIQEIQVDGTYVVDNGHAVAWDTSLQYRLTRARKIRSFLFGDQLLLSFSGRGRLWVQNRSARSLASWVHPFRRQKPKNNS